MGALDQLLQRNVLWRGGSLGASLDAVASGFACLDEQLPGGGWPRAGLSELLADAEGIGELALVLPALARLTGAGKRVIWVGPPHVPYAPALAAAGPPFLGLLLPGRGRRAARRRGGAAREGG